MIFDRELYLELRDAWLTAEAANIEQFEFHGTVFLTSYAKYLVEYLAWKWGN